MKITREYASPAALSNTTLGGNPVVPVTPPDPGDVPDPIDLALDAEATVPFVISGTPAYVQSAYALNDGFNTITVVLSSAPTPGNILVGWQTERATPLPQGPAGWTAHPDGQKRVQAGGGYTQMYYKVAQTGESATIIFNSNNNNNHVASVVEISGVATVQDHDAVGETFSATQTLSLTASSAAIIIAGISIQINDTEAATITPSSGVTELVDTPAGSGAWPRHWLGYRIVAAGTFAIGATYPFSQWWAEEALVFGGGDTVRLDAPDTVDGDDATYTLDTSNLADGLHVDLGAPTRLTSVRLFLGSETSGSKTYELWAANEDDFSDEVMIATETFTATGSLTGDEVLYAILTPQAYRYFRLDGETEDRRWYTFEAYGITGFALALDDLTDVDTTGVADLDVLTYDAATLTWIAAPPPGGTSDITDLPTAETDTTLVLHPDGAGGVEWGVDDTGGGGGGSDPIFDRFGTPDTAFEFGSSSLTGLTALSPTPDVVDADTTVPDAYYIKDDAAGVAMVGHYASVSSPCTAIIRILDARWRGDFNYAGLFVGESTPGKMRYVNQRQALRRPGVLALANPTDGSASTVVDWSIHEKAFDAPLYFAIVVNSSTDIDFLISNGGYVWMSLLTAHNPSFTVGSLGIAIMAINSTVGMAAAFDYLRIWNSALSLPGSD